ncbi:Hypp3847 [Branchiostoma lanceolatum]|uniref:Hypp3847 protein n=1 Tax=Branchiostoma lanceolatum TaxID=7740 RepID=A0A8K0A2X6_BRALA|nr:Hypp3847 [Branchiostoma lanceolatum]
MITRSFELFVLPQRDPPALLSGVSRNLRLSIMDYLPATFRAPSGGGRVLEPRRGDVSITATSCGCGAVYVPCLMMPGSYICLLTLYINGLSLPGPPQLTRGEGSIGSIDWPGERIDIGCGGATQRPGLR